MAIHSKETWQNVTRGSVGLLKLDSRGVEKGVVVPAGGKISLTVEERRMNQDRAATKPQDLFGNGTLAPIRLIDDPELGEEYAQIKDNPNFISETEMKQLFSKRIDTFKRELAKIDNPAVVQRIKDIAVEADAKASQTAAIEERLREFNPQVVEVEQVAPPARQMRPVSP